MRAIDSFRALALVPGLVLMGGLAPGSAESAPPTDFVFETVTTSLAQPVAMAYLPDGRLLVAEQKTGDLRLITADDQLQRTAVLTVPGLDTMHGEAGLLSLAIDPAWPTRPYLYCHYDALIPNEIRLTRFTATGSLDDPLSANLSFAPSSAVNLLTGIPDLAGNHNGGTLRFGPDGALYFSMGDDENRCASQNVDDFRGKILRLKVDSIGPTGPVSLATLVAAGNPHVGEGEIASLVWARGLRNPFRMAIDAATGALFVGDVGQLAREEIDHVTEGGLNLGWPYREGSIAFTPPAECSDASGLVFLEPIFDYGRTDGASVIAGFVYRRPPGAVRPWPLDHEGSFFFVDFFRGDLKRLVGSGQNWSIAAPVPGQPAPDDWANGLSNPTDFAIAPDGSVSFTELGGSLRRIIYTGTIVAAPPAGFGQFRASYAN